MMNDGPLLQATIEEPGAIAADKNGNVFVFDKWKNVMRQFARSGCNQKKALKIDND
ncbi:hypothetical protein [Chitinophaga ginsengisoli]|uniref:NHL repeat-containing protein n=1 Tax=Chitinophaga ginsengisoli TaxID=363837 RepID=A0A2P8G5B4_9BACT|nr:hypothetical protein [Chitinophaga ginsengisoli]PSL29159.1 hypothetical protein CLV42_107306 [Chitinophaga ginsengisoli]